MLKLNHLDYYRLPWNLADNSISWLEPTAKCNLYCDGCYRKNENDSHKSIDEIRNELDTFTSLRKCDGVSIAGGDPLTHPNIIDIVKEVKVRDLKPIINTNGLALTPELLSELKKRGYSDSHFISTASKAGHTGKEKMKLNLMNCGIIMPG
jgi:MoaA/NifB/PqqE/SkfB family radical SAM enzyme